MGSDSGHCPFFYSPNLDIMVYLLSGKISFQGPFKNVYKIHDNIIKVIYTKMNILKRGMENQKK